MIFNALQDCLSNKSVSRRMTDLWNYCAIRLQPLHEEMFEAEVGLRVDVDAVFVLRLIGIV